MMFKMIIQNSSPFLGLSRDLSISNSSCPNLSSISTFKRIKTLPLPGKFLGYHFPGKIHGFRGKIGVFNAWSRDESSLQEVDDSPVSFELEPICSESQFDRVIAEAQLLEESVIIVWMASWCRKCIYLKPKLEKLAADYYPSVIPESLIYDCPGLLGRKKYPINQLVISKLRFYCVDVNNIPHKLVAYAGVTKMPTIQLWKDCKKQAEVIGGHKAYLVVNEVREMIENESSTL